MTVFAAFIAVIFGRVTEQLRQVVGAILAILAVNLVNVLPGSLHVTDPDMMPDA